MLDLKKTVLLLTDFSYQAKGREYFREDLVLSEYLRNHFKVCISHIEDCDPVLDRADVILIRNTGPQNSHRERLNSLKNRRDLVFFNDLSGKGDMKGKSHLLELYQAGYPVIPSFASISQLKGNEDRYLLKPLDSADSCGVQILSYTSLDASLCKNMILQPVVEFLHEVSFYFIGRDFCYALYAPHREKRWDLKLYMASEADVAFAQKFIEWNTCKWGIQRVDACRLHDGRLLLMELEDYNPFLSLDVLPDAMKKEFLEKLCAEITRLTFDSCREKIGASNYIGR